MTHVPYKVPLSQSVDVASGVSTATRHDISDLASLSVRKSSILGSQRPTSPLLPEVRLGRAICNSAGFSMGLVVPQDSRTHRRALNKHARNSGRGHVRGSYFKQAYNQELHRPKNWPKYRSGNEKLPCKILKTNLALTPAKISLAQTDCLCPR